MEIYNFNIDDNSYEVRILSVKGRNAEVEVNGIKYLIDIAEMGFDPNYIEELKLNQPRVKFRSDNGEIPHYHPRIGSQQKSHVQPPAAGGKIQLKAPMPGQVLKVLKKDGERVAQDEVILVIEAMKMENPLKAVNPGTIEKIYVSAGDTLSEGQLLVILNAEQAAPQPQPAAPPPAAAPAAGAPPQAAGTGRVVTSPMPGSIFKILKSQGDKVEPEEVVLIIEAMKMENQVKAGQKGTLSEILVEAGATVKEGQKLFAVSTETEDAAEPAPKAAEAAAQAAGPVKPAGSGGKGAPKSGALQVTAPMPGSVYKLMVSEGSKVKTGETLLIMEAMKMENPIKSPADGVVKGLSVKEGDAISDGALLMSIC